MLKNVFCSQTGANKDQLLVVVFWEAVSTAAVQEVKGRILVD